MVIECVNKRKVYFIVNNICKWKEPNGKVEKYHSLEWMMDGMAE